MGEGEQVLGRPDRVDRRDRSGPFVARQYQSLGARVRQLPVAEAGGVLPAGPELQVPGCEGPDPSGPGAGDQFLREVGEEPAVLALDGKTAGAQAPSVFSLAFPAYIICTQQEHHDGH